MRHIPSRADLGDRKYVRVILGRDDFEDAKSEILNELKILQETIAELAIEDVRHSEFDHIKRSIYSIADGEPLKMLDYGTVVDADEDETLVSIKDGETYKALHEITKNSEL